MVLDRCLPGGGTSLLGETGLDRDGMGQGRGLLMIDRTRGDRNGFRVPEDPRTSVISDLPRGGIEDEAVDD